ncbi:DNA-binding transcriptional activator of the SARP family [Sinosporangium album]|uniref:DNA-binding transcriptional activator of the SARP family n=2 Tax=Sinosporangium album TaxID=504805 RepID=A0A1G8ICR3_9ACTN|nr:DNA-binding transcriptional activator of the SARP family [Sinosporangium album]
MGDIVGDLNINILGSVAIQHGEHAISVSPPKARALLVILAIRSHEVISRDELIDAIWGHRPPSAARSNVHTYVTALRRLLTGDLLVTTPPGYLLRLGREQLDSRRFEATLAQARGRRTAGEHEPALRLYDAALALWRGASILGTPGPFAEAARARLDELRLITLEERVHVMLELGRHTEVLSDVAALARHHPLNERLRGLHMLALYRNGRQADAFHVFEDTRRALAEELGVEPSRELRRWHERILQADAGAIGL